MTPGDFDMRLSELRAARPAVQQRQPVFPGERELSAGEAAEGQVRVTAAEGLLDGCVIDPRLMRAAPAELAGWLLTAANSALAQSVVPPSSGLAVDVDALQTQLEQARNEGLGQLERMTRGLQEAVAVIRQRAVMRGEVDTGGLEQLLDGAVRNVAAVRATPSEGPPEPPAQAYGMDGLVRVAAASGTRLNSISIDERALRRASQQLAAETVRAGNAALEEMRARAIDRLRRAGEGLRTRIAEIQDASLAQMRTYTRSVTDLMSGIEPPSI